jgi:hypothetical protein
MATYRTGPSERSINPGPEITLVDDFADACTVVSRAADGRTFACARPRGHRFTEHYGRDNRGPVRLGYGR